MLGLNLKRPYNKSLRRTSIYLMIGCVYSRLTSPITGHVTTEQLLDKKATLPHSSNSVSSIGVMLSHPSLLLNRNPKRVSKFYRKQSDLMENFKRDSTAIEVRFLTFINFSFNIHV